MADPNEKVADLPPLSMRAAFTPGTVNEDARTVEVTWTTGARVLRGFFDPYYEELSLDPKHVRMKRLNNGAPFLANHDGADVSAVIGVVEAGSARLEGKKGTALVRFARAEDDPEADKVFRKVKDGILCNVSVGYRVYRLEETDQSVGKVPVRSATDWEPYELSVVPMGADDGAGFRGSDRSPNPCTLIAARQETTNMAEENKTETAPGADPTERLVAEVREQNARAAEAEAASNARAAEVAAAQERERIAEITKLVRMTKLGDAFAEKVIKAGTKLDKVREIVLQELARQSDESAESPHVRFSAGEDARDKFVAGGVASILERAGQTSLVRAAAKVERFADQFKGLATDPGEFRGMRLYDLARASLERRGVSTRGLHGEGLIRRALEFRDSGMNTSSDFTVLLETAVNRTFLGGYALAPVTWPSWAARKSVQDFRTTTFYRPGTFGNLDAVTEAGEVKHKNIPDGAKATLSPATKGNIIGITRRALVNDDLSVFRDLGAGLGQAAAYTVEADAFALITAASGLGANAPDGVALFNAAHSNIGSTGAMSVATLDSMRAKMGLQKDASGNRYLALRPKVLLVPIELAGEAKKFNASTADPTDSKNSNVANKVYGLFDQIIDSGYLSASSATRVYALADPSLYPTFAVGFIDGQEVPRIESEQVFGYDGLQMKVILDYGTAVLDYRGAATCAGA